LGYAAFIERHASHFQQPILAIEMTNKDTTESDFYFHAKMLGINQTQPNKFTFGGRTYTAHAQANGAMAKALGGKARAFKLLRHAELIRHLAADPANANIAPYIGKSFDAVSQKYPLLRSYYDATMIGGHHQAWLRWRA
jgi:hypothetical protein